MSLESQQLFSSLSPPNLTCSIITSCDEFVALLVERTVCQRQYVRTQNFK